MITRIRAGKGQSTLEYALLVSAVIVGLLAVNTYMRRGMQGRLKESVDDIGTQFDANRSYSVSWRAESVGNTTVAEVRDVNRGNITSNISASENVTRSEYEAFGDTVTSRY